MNLADLSNDELLVGIHSLVGQGRQLLARLLAYLGEVEERRLDLQSACSSLFDFCVRRLGMSEDEACRRVAAARLVRRFPIALGMIERGEMYLTGLLMLREHLSPQNGEGLLRAAAGKSKSELQHLLAERFPRPDVPSRLELIGGPSQASLGGTTPMAWERSESASPAQRADASSRSRIEPLAPARYRVEFTANAGLREKLQRAADLMRHTNPSGDLAVLVERALDTLLPKLETQRLAKPARPARPAGSTSVISQGPPSERSVPKDSPSERSVLKDSPSERSVLKGSPSERSVPKDSRSERSVPKDSPSERSVLKGSPSARTVPQHSASRSTRPGYVPRAVRRAVFERDGERCAFIDEHGQRCECRTWLELDHAIPRALGGADDPDNLSVRCRAHNYLAAELLFGREHIERRIAERRFVKPPRQELSDRPRQRGNLTPAVESDIKLALHALCGMGFRAREGRRALGIVRQRRAAPCSIETLLREALAVLA
jgi:hypothetical protein